MRKIFFLLSISFFMLQSCYQEDKTEATVKDIEGNTYLIVQISNQTWMKSNLNVSHYRNGDEIPQVQDPAEWSALTTGAWCYYENNTENGNLYAYRKLYNWYALNDPRGLAPEGWHVPSNDEWKTLTTNLGGENVAGGKMKTPTNWVGSPTQDTNRSGFTGLPGGFRHSDGSFYKFGTEGYWWSSSEYDTDRVWYRLLSYNNPFAVSVYCNKANGLSVRCVRD